MEKFATIILVTCLTSFVVLSLTLAYESLNKKKYFRAYLSVKERIKGSVKWKFRAAAHVKKAA